MITPNYYIDWRSQAGRKAVKECPYLPLAMAEASKFYRKQERGRFKFEDLLQVATEALITSKGVKAIRGALLDHARDDRKLVHDVEMSEAEYVRTRGDLAPKPPPPARSADISTSTTEKTFGSGFIRRARTAAITSFSPVAARSVASTTRSASLSGGRSTKTDGLRSLAGRPARRSTRAPTTRVHSIQEALT